MKDKFIITTVVIFVVLTAAFYVLELYVPHFNFVALETGNLIMAVLAFVSYLLVKKQAAGKPHAFVRGVAGASFMRMMVCMIAALVYVLLNRTNIHKPTVFVLFGIYAIYTAMETVLLSKMARQK